MLSNKKPEYVEKDDILFLLNGLMQNTKNTDDWYGWIGDDDIWTDGKVYRCLEILHELLSSGALVMPKKLNTEGP